LFSRLWRSAAAERIEPAVAYDPDADIDAGKLIDAAEELAQMFYAAYAESNGRLHAETALGGAAALTGEFVLRSTGLPLPEFGFVLDDAIDDLLYRSETRVTIFHVLAMTVGVTRLQALQLPDPNEIVRRVACGMQQAARGEANNFPPLSVPRANFPREWSPNACLRLRRNVLAIGRRHRFTPRQTAFALAYAIVSIIRYLQQVLDPAIAVRLAAEIMFATARMAPLNRSF
jgi:hypothetical protein